MQRCTTIPNLAFHAGFDIKVLDFPDPIGALIDIPVDFPLGDVGLYDNTFALNFNSQNYAFVV
jgi:hypothetical protein